MKTVLFVIAALSLGSSFYTNSVNNVKFKGVDFTPRDNGGCKDCSDNCDEKEHLRIPRPQIIQNPGFTMENYFEHLTSYSPDNTDGSCSYVSLIQYLTYYDTFLNDNIIPEAYDQHNLFAVNLAAAKNNSPGVVKRSYPSGSSALYNYVMANKDDDFQAYLMYVVNSALGHTSSNYSQQVAYSDYHYIFEDLLYANGSITSTTAYYTNYGTSYTNSTVQTSMINLAKSIIDTGNPVLLQIVNSDMSENHAVVAYDYDSVGLICNYGWDGTGWTTMYSPNIIHTHIYAVTYSNITDIGHRHSNNYCVQTLEYCGCGEHSHSRTFSSITSTTHTRTCLCGYSAVENHIYEYIHGTWKCVCGKFQ